MEEYDYRRLPNQAGYGLQAYYADRGAPLNESHLSRSDPRAYPMAGGPGANLRMRSGMGGEPIQENGGPSRKRIPVACARCRKRKIRCSGDPGNGSGCQNCRQAGIEMGLCQFHRVGSNDPSVILTAYALHSGLSNGLMSSPNGLPLYSTSGNTLYSRSQSVGQYAPQLETRPLYPQTWTIPYPENTSPIETYGLDQSTAYISNPSMTNMYPQDYGWNQSGQRTIRSGGPFSDQDPSLPCTTAGVPYFQTSNLRTTATTEPLSPLNMSSIQSALPTSSPKRLQPRFSQPDLAVPQRRLPLPQNSAQNIRSSVDLLHDQRLRSGQIVNSTSTNLTGYSMKPIMPWNAGSTTSDMQSTSSSEGSSIEMAAGTTASTAPAPERLLEYVPVTAPNTEVKTTVTSQPQLNFTTFTMLESTPALTTTAQYSNFRNYAVPTSSSAEPFSMLARQSSESNLYSYSSERGAKRDLAGNTSNSGGVLVSGQRYTPLGQPTQSHYSTGMRKDSFETRPSPVQRTSISRRDCNF